MPASVLFVEHIFRRKSADHWQIVHRGIEEKILYVTGLGGVASVQFIITKSVPQISKNGDVGLIDKSIELKKQGGERDEKNRRSFRRYSFFKERASAFDLVVEDRL